MTGYIHPMYAESLKEFGAPQGLRRCGGSVLKRQIPISSDHDAMGCYPLFACRDWSKLHLDLENFNDELISLSLVADPFGDYTPAYLHECCDVVIPFKEHFIADLNQPINVVASKHHRYYARKSLKYIHIERCQYPTQLINEWVNLYAVLTQRHNLRGIKALSRAAFAKQLTVPGIVMFRAISGGATVGAHLWYTQGEVAYSHLAAFSPLGYDLMASYALYWSAIEYFADKVRWLDLGADAGINSNSNDGLSQFKRGWSTGTRTAFFLGRIFNLKRYWEIARKKGVSDTDYFPAYRKGEFI